MIKHFGYTLDEYDAWALRARALLELKASTGDLSNYTEVNDHLGRPFNFDNPADRKAMGHVLFLVTESTIEQVGYMLSSLVIFLHDDRAGSGFFRYAQELGRLDHGASWSDRMAFMFAEQRGVHAHYGGVSHYYSEDMK